MLDLIFWVAVGFVMLLGAEEWWQKRRGRQRLETNHMDMETIRGPKRKGQVD